MRYTVLGAGAMGSTVASRLLANGHEVRLWFTEKDEWLLPKVSATEKHPLSGAGLRGAHLSGPDDLAAALDKSEALVVACSSEGLRAVVGLVRDSLAGSLIPALAVTKGFVEDGDGISTVSDILSRAGFRDFALVGGPMIASEIAAGRPAGGVLASSSSKALSAGRGLASASLSLSETDDVRGVELCAALKNVYAILVGLCEARGANLRALAFARSLEEMRDVVVELGGHEETVLGPAGSGDLYVTSLSGRNGEFGRRFGAGEDPRAAYREMEASGKTVEGVRAATLGQQYLEKHGARAPLVSCVAAVCGGKLTPDEAVRSVLR